MKTILTINCENLIIDFDCGVLSMYIIYPKSKDQKNIISLMLIILNPNLYGYVNNSYSMPFCKFVSSIIPRYNEIFIHTLILMILQKWLWKLI